MSLHIDPILHTEFDEPPYDFKERRLYTLAAPFGAAIDEWVRRQELIAGGPLREQSGRSNGSGMAAIAGLGELANLAGLTTRTLFRYTTGESWLIELRVADRLALALDIPLPLLADDFRTMHEWRIANFETEAAA